MNNIRVKQYNLYRKLNYKLIKAQYVYINKNEGNIHINKSYTKMVTLLQVRSQRGGGGQGGG